MPSPWNPEFFLLRLLCRLIWLLIALLPELLRSDGSQGPGHFCQMLLVVSTHAVLHTVSNELGAGRPGLRLGMCNSVSFKALSMKRKQRPRACLLTFSADVHYFGKLMVSTGAQCPTKLSAW